MLKNHCKKEEVSCDVSSFFSSSTSHLVWPSPQDKVPVDLSRIKIVKTIIFSSVRWFLHEKAVRRWVHAFIEFDYEGLIEEKNLNHFF